MRNNRNLLLYFTLLRSNFYIGKGNRIFSNYYNYYYNYYCSYFINYNYCTKYYLYYFINCNYRITNGRNVRSRGSGYSYFYI